ncbi:uncharacterized protein LOC142007160 isoform X2 [Carettochelys insculpta]|uniref:uncharacterized protein LOC142007160 isoform X2 n=1 Tax=Carettochelys insculpta TaxID=44489 RepID=UPI003EBC1847
MMSHPAVFIYMGRPTGKGQNCSSELKTTRLCSKISSQQKVTIFMNKSMSQPRRISRHFVLSHDRSGVTVPNEDSHNGLLTIPDTTEQMEFNISSATQVGHQLAVIGDEFNITYTRKLEDTLLHLAQGMAVNALKMLQMHVWRSVKKSFRSLLSNGWTKRAVAYGRWISWLPLKSMCQRLMPAALFVVLFWWTVSYGLQN